MSYLLDTHYLIWSIANPGLIPHHIKNILTDPANEIIVSSVSLWEISLKYSLGKIRLEGILPHEIPAECELMDFRIIDLTADETSTYHQLSATHHKDPFDRMLIWQAIRNDFMLITADKDVAQYKTDGLKVIT
ncbi:MAG: type II toxin-antitoxin system VapC family toxin [Flavisolibacter sp.]